MTNIVNPRYALEALRKHGELQRAVGFVRGFMAGQKAEKDRVLRCVVASIKWDGKIEKDVAE